MCEPVSLATTALSAGAGILSNVLSSKPKTKTVRTGASWSPMDIMGFIGQQQQAQRSRQLSSLQAGEVDWSTDWTVRDLNRAKAQALAAQQTSWTAGGQGVQGGAGGVRTDQGTPLDHYAQAEAAAENDTNLAQYAGDMEAWRIRLEGEMGAMSTEIGALTGLAGAGAANDRSYTVQKPQDNTLSTILGGVSTVAGGLGGMIGSGGGDLGGSAAYAKNSMSIRNTMARTGFRGR